MLIDFCTEHIKQTDCCATPFNHDIVARLKHGGYLHPVMASPAAIIGVILEAALHVILLQIQYTKIYKQPAVTVLW